MNSAADRDDLRRFLLPAIPDPDTQIESLMWAMLEIQGNSTWTVVDTGSVSNIISARFYQSLHGHAPPRPERKDERLISGHLALSLLGKVVLRYRLTAVPNLLPSK